MMASEFPLHMLWAIDLHAFRVQVCAEGLKRGCITQAFYRTFYRTLTMNPSPVAGAHKGRRHTQGSGFASWEQSVIHSGDQSQRKLQ